MIRLDPRVKILCVIIISTFAIMLSDVYSLLILLGINLAIGIIVGVDYLSFIRRARYLFVLVISLSIIQSIFTADGSPLIEIGNFTLLTDYGLDMGLQFIIRMSVIMSSAMIISTSNISETTDALIKLKLPYELAFMMGISIKFLPEFRRDFKRRLTALQLRGVNISSLSIAKKIKIYTYLISPVVSNSLIKSEMLGISMQTRAFKAYKRRGMMRELKFSYIDYIATLLAISGAVLGAIIMIKG